MASYEHLWHPDMQCYSDPDLCSHNIDRLRRALCFVTRELQNTKKELAVAKDALGYYNGPFNFLRLPREVRDQIYVYGLVAEDAVRVEPRTMEELSLEPATWKPSTPSLCLINKQTHREANEVLYAQNTFRFCLPAELTRFEDEIGQYNKCLVRRLQLNVIPMAIPYLGFDLIAPCDYKGEPEFWARTLRESSLNGINTIIIFASRSATDESKPDAMPLALQQAIEIVFERSRNSILTQFLSIEICYCFREVERKLFPEHWKVKIRNWNCGNGDVSAPSLEWHDA